MRRTQLRFLGENSVWRPCGALKVCAPLPRGPAVRPLSFSKLNLFNKHIIQQEEQEESDKLPFGRSKSNSSSSSSCTIWLLNKFNLLIVHVLCLARAPPHRTPKPNMKSKNPQNRKPKTRTPKPRSQNPLAGNSELGSQLEGSEL